MSPSDKKKPPLSVGASGVFNTSPYPTFLKNSSPPIQEDTRSSSPGGFTNALHMATWDYAEDPSHHHDMVAGEQDVLNETNGGSGCYGPNVHGLIYGVINTVITVPSMIGFASIIYDNKFFVPYMPMLRKLVLLSSATHMLCFMAVSSLPFAVAQVQDAGLVFLAQMANKVVENMNVTNDKDEPVYSDEEVIATVVVTLSICTAVAGILLVITGKLKLAGYVQYLPLPVIGGYLAYIGLYCGEAAIKIMTGVKDIRGIGGWFHVIVQGNHVIHILPGVFCAVILLLITKYGTHQLMLPCSLVLIPVVYFAILLIGGIPMEEARDEGWMGHYNASEVEPFYHMFNLFDFPKVHLDKAFPDVIQTLLAMYFVVAFGSCLDVAAIQYDSGKPLDFDHELKTVGCSNVVSGMLGGYTGSYIFSQTLFSLRNNVNSKLNGFAIVFCELLLVVLPYDIVAFLPNFYFGSVMLFISIDLLFDWLVHSFYKVELREYLLTWGTFIAICFVGLEKGMGVGVVLATLNFVYSYSSTTTVEVISARSDVVRGYKDRKLLSKCRHAIVTLRLKGYQFFGSTLQITEAIQSRVTIEVSEPEIASADDQSARRPRDVALSNNNTVLSSDSLGHDDDFDEVGALLESREATTDGGSVRGVVASSSTMQEDFSGPQKRFRKLGPSSNHVATKDHVGLSATPYFTKLARDYLMMRRDALKEIAEEGTGKQHSIQHLDSAFDLNMEGHHEPALATRFVVLDCSQVTAIDATAARSCFLSLRQSLERHGIQIVFANLPRKSKRLLHAHGVISKEQELHGGAPVVPTSSLQEPLLGDEESQATKQPEGGYAATLSPCVFDSLDEALEYCEDSLISELRDEPRFNLGSDVGSAGASTPSSLANRDSGGSGYSAPDVLETFLSGQIRTLAQDMSLNIQAYFQRMELQPGAVLFDIGAPASDIYLLESGEVSLLPVKKDDLHELHGVDRKHVLRYVGGGLIGELDFYLDRPRRFCAMVEKGARDDKAAVVHRLSRAAFDRMKEVDPNFAVMFQHSILKSLALSSSTIARV